MGSARHYPDFYTAARIRLNEIGQVGRSAAIEQETQKPESDQATRPVVIDQEIDDWYDQIGAMKT